MAGNVSMHIQQQPQQQEIREWQSSNSFHAMRLEPSVTQHRGLLSASLADPISFLPRSDTSTPSGNKNLHTQFRHSRFHPSLHFCGCVALPCALLLTKKRKIWRNNACWNYIIKIWKKKYLNLNLKTDTPCSNNKRACKHIHLNMWHGTHKLASMLL